MNKYSSTQAMMDAAGFITHIKPIMMKREKLWDDDGASATYRGWYYRYKYNYEISINGEIVAVRKSRRAAKNLLNRKFKEHELGKTK